MAKFSPILGHLSGKVAGSVFSSNSAGAYVRQKTSPANRNTSRQQAVRSRLSYLSSMWQTVGPGGQAAWANYGAANPHTDAFGADIALSGQQAYVMLNARRGNLGDTAPLGTPPAVQNTAVPFSGTVAWSAAAGYVTLTGFAALAAGARIEVLATPPGSAGKNPNFRAARWMGATAAAASSPATVAMGVTATAGQVSNIFLRVTDTYGQSNTPVLIRTTVVA